MISKSTLSLILLLPCAYVCLYYGLTEPIVTISSVSFGDDDIKPVHITKSTLESIRHLFTEGFYLPASLILVFSVLIPIVKFFGICAMIIGKEYAPHRSARWSYNLRVFAKFQLLDVFVAIIMLSFLNQAVIITRLEQGFSFYMIFCVLSVIIAQIIALRSESVKEGDGVSKASLVDNVFVLMGIGCFFIGLIWAMIFPVLVVKVSFQGTLIVSQSLQALGSMIYGLLALPNLDGLPIINFPNISAFILFTFVVVIPAVHAILILSTIKAGKASAQFLKFLDYLGDWQMVDVFSLALFTSLVSLNSFDGLRADAPDGKYSGFYFLLMAGFASFELCLTANGYRCSAEDSLPSASEEPLLIDHESSVPNLSLPSPAMNRRHVAKEVSKRLSGSVLAMKAVGWGIFFLVWATHVQDLPVDLDGVNAQIRQNMPIINKALQTALPMTVGNCSANITNGTSTIAPPAPCEGNNSDLYYQRSTFYEVKARWITGLQLTTVNVIYLSVPSTGFMALSIDGVFPSLPLSLYIAECSTPDVWISGKCDKLWDNTEACCGENKRFSIVITSQCQDTNTSMPYIHNASIHSIHLDQMSVKESVMGLVTINLKDVTDTVGNAVKGAIEPYLGDSMPFIQWPGEKNNITLTGLINKFLVLNSGQTFKCPLPLGGR